ncbi:ABC transporter permease [Chitinophaga japonensis]|uniref:ABC-type antimicrobial peptide transport system permease subunit n=1 Tax=Chitinophaga japonensis TaxID=104662 RepID=A0A562TEH4_CHIJA|nr:ABC transporter permease [Chitinophaga japonensis]TWI91947.1 ABC-type antimicrobial peptide transport system permease subunit [Chitinophaga japonensis]
MFRNYLKIAWRNLWKSRLLTAVNILGLAVAFTASILLVLTAAREFSFDQFHDHKQQLQQLYISVHHVQGTEERSNLPMPLTPALKQEFPEVKAASRFMDASGMVRYRDKMYGSDVMGVDPDFLRMFSFPLLSGEKQQPLRSLSNVVITERMARKIFGSAEPVGQSLEMYLEGRWKTFIVSAVAEDVPDNSSLEFDMLCRFEHVPAYADQKDAWNSSTHEVFVQLSDQATAAAFERRAKTFVNKYFAEGIRNLQRDGAVPGKDGALIGLHLMPLTDIHFNSISSSGGAISRFYPYMLLLIGIFILFIACVNFMNLTIAGAFSRSREIGMRKILGAFRGQVIMQLWGEAVLVCGLALLAGMAMAYFLLPGYNALFSNRLSLNLLRQPWLLPGLFLVFVLVTLVAGGYPALMIARLNTIKVLKGSLLTGRSNRVRNVLIVTQFVISSLLICCTLIAWQQLNYLRKKPLGYSKEQVISIPVPYNVDAELALTRMRNQLSGHAGILAVTGTDINMGRGRDGSSATSIVSFDYKGREVRSHWLRVDYDYVGAMGLQLVAGRDFSRAYGTDSSALLINEKMAAQLGGMEAALGALLPVEDSAHPQQVIGIVKDFNFKSLKEEIGPLTLNINKEWPLQYIFVKVAAGNLPGYMNLVKQQWQALYPGSSTDPSFLDENTDRQYRREQRFSGIFISAAVLAIIISCMGLFAISVLIMTRRTREVGVRKVLGASVAGIVTLLSKDFVKLVLLSVMIASPVAWYIMEQWLQHYAYRIPVNIGVFLLAGAIALLVAVITVSIQSVRAALMNPVKSIRTE